MKNSLNRWIALVAGENLATLRRALTQNSSQARESANTALRRFIASDYEGGKLRATKFTGPDGATYQVRIEGRRTRSYASKKRKYANSPAMRLFRTEPIANVFPQTSALMFGMVTSPRSSTMIGGRRKIPPKPKVG